MKNIKATFQAFLDAWKKKDWERMYELSQITWKENNTSEVLQNRFGAMEIKGYQVKGIKKPTGAVADCTFIVKVNGRWTAKSIGRLICETGPYSADEKGTWGVNPISVMRIFSK